MAETNRGCVIAGIAAGVLLLLFICAGLGVAAYYFYLTPQAPVRPVPVPIPGMPEVPGAPAKPEGSTAGVPGDGGLDPNSVADDDLVLAAEAMYRYANQAAAPYQVDGVEVRGNRAIGNYTPVRRDGSVDPERPGGQFVARKVNGAWQVYALGTDIIDPWAEPIERIYGTP